MRRERRDDEYTDEKKRTNKKEHEKAPKEYEENVQVDET